MLLTGLQTLILSFALVQDNVDNLVVLADVFGGLGHQSIDDFTEEGDITSRVSTDPRHKFGHRPFMLRGVWVRCVGVR